MPCTPLAARDPKDSLALPCAQIFWSNLKHLRLSRPSDTPSDEWASDPRVLDSIHLVRRHSLVGAAPNGAEVEASLQV